jgi:D-alanine-D-alanine ligase
MKKTSFGRIGVLAGGPSSEREISLRSGKAVYEALVSEGLETMLFDVKDDLSGVINGGGIDIAFIALHGRFGEDGTVQRMLRDARIPYTGSGAEASALAMDKIASKKIFIANGIRVPDYVVFEKGCFCARDAERVGYPLVVKPQFEGSSIGLSMARDARSLPDALARAFIYGDRAIVEKYISGRELTVGILGDEALPVIEIVTKNNVYDYEAKYESADTRYVVPAPVDARVYREAMRLGAAAHRALGCSSFSRVDMIADETGGLFVLEVNTIPGMTERSLLPKAAQASGLRFAELCVKILEYTVKRSGVLGNRA